MTSVAEVEALIPSQSFFRLREVVEILGVNYQTLYSWTRSKPPILPTIKMGKVHLVCRPDLIRALMGSGRPPECR
jgi:predicted site-specific integrase-resolvase